MRKPPRKVSKKIRKDNFDENLNNWLANIIKPKLFWIHSLKIHLNTTHRKNNVTYCLPMPNASSMPVKGNLLIISAITLFN